MPFSTRANPASRCSSSGAVIARLARILRLDLTELTGTETEAVTDTRYDAARAIERAADLIDRLQPATPVGLFDNRDNRDNRDTWDNVGGGPWDNRSTWDNWKK